MTKGTDGIFEKPIETMESEMDGADDLLDHHAMAAAENQIHLTEFELMNETLGMTNKIPPMYDGKTSWFQY